MNARVLLTFYEEGIKQGKGLLGVIVEFCLPQRVFSAAHMENEGITWMWMSGEVGTLEKEGNLTYGDFLNQFIVNYDEQKCIKYKYN